MFAGVLVMDAAKASFDITVTCGQATTGLPPPDDGAVTGYSASGRGLSPVGSRSPSSYSDNLGNSRTVTECCNVTGSTVTPTFVFGIDGASVPNANATFRQLVVNGTVLDRGDAFYSSNDGGDTTWAWSSGLPTIPSSGNITLTIRF